MTNFIGQDDYFGVVVGCRRFTDYVIGKLLGRIESQVGLSVQWNQSAKL